MKNIDTFEKFILKKVVSIWFHSLNTLLHFNSGLVRNSCVLSENLLTMNDIKDDLFSIACENTISNWTKGIFRYLLPKTFSVDNESLFVCSLKYISLDFYVNNVTNHDYVNYKTNDNPFWLQFSPSSGFCATNEELIDKLNTAVPETVFIKFQIDSATKRAVIEIDVENVQVSLSRQLSDKLGIASDRVFAFGTTTGDRPPNVWNGYELVNVVCPNLCEPIIDRQQPKSILRCFSVPTQQLTHSLRVNIDFTQDEWWLPLSTNQLSVIDFRLENAISQKQFVIFGAD